ncbi:MAG: hypothetical protein OEV47_16715, partial [Gammaproteobacteria bacterium]|nr:hypothetical protein [Gammaproteobacteria bacterium]
MACNARYAAALLCAATLLASCASHGPQLSTLYKTAGETGLQPPVILIHGAFGGRLCDDSGEEYWPGSFFNILLGDYQTLSLPVPAATQHGAQAA